jgi:hypothetical protein
VQMRSRRRRSSLIRAIGRRDWGEAAVVEFQVWTEDLDCCRAYVLNIEHHSLCSATGIPHSTQILTLWTGRLRFHHSSFFKRFISTSLKCLLATNRKEFRLPLCSEPGAVGLECSLQAGYPAQAKACTPNLPLPVLYSRCAP